MALQVDAVGLRRIFPTLYNGTKLAELFLPEAAVRTPDQSLLFIKKVFAIAASNILYLRNVFPDDAFEKFICDKKMELNLLCPTRSSDNSKAVRIVEYFINTFEAIEKKFLKTLIIDILYKDTDGEALIEAYAFHFDYNDEIEVTISKNNTNEIKAIYTKDPSQLIASVRALMRQIQTLCSTTQSAIHENANPKVTLRAYYNSNAPKGYQIHGFVPLKSEPTGPEREPLTWLGCVSSLFHSMKLEHKTIEGESKYFRDKYDGN